MQYSGCTVCSQLFKAEAEWVQGPTGTALQCWHFSCLPKPWQWQHRKPQAGSHLSASHCCHPPLSHLHILHSSLPPPRDNVCIKIGFEKLKIAKKRTREHLLTLPAELLLLSSTSSSAAGKSLSQSAAQELRPQHPLSHIHPWEERRPPCQQAASPPRPIPAFREGRGGLADCRLRALLGFCRAEVTEPMGGRGLSLQPPGMGTGIGMRIEMGRET